jgi:two-component system sensor histidine kinase YesM
MFRVGLSQGQDIITLKDELSHASNYLYIQGIRYSEKIRYQIDVSDTLQKYLVPKLILQPLIENAIYHGLKAKDEGGTISIGGYLEAEELILTVSDDGLGVSVEELDQIRLTLNREKSRDSFGLYYVNDRIKLHCGEDYGIYMESEEGKGTTVSLHLPLTQL